MSAPRPLPPWLAEIERELVGKMDVWPWSELRRLLAVIEVQREALAVSDGHLLATGTAAERVAVYDRARRLYEGEGGAE